MSLKKNYDYTRCIHCFEAKPAEQMNKVGIFATSRVPKEMYLCKECCEHGWSISAEDEQLAALKGELKDCTGGLDSK